MVIGSLTPSGHTYSGHLNGTGISLMRATFLSICHYPWDILPSTHILCHVKAPLISLCAQILRPLSSALAIPHTTVILEFHTVYDGFTILCNAMRSDFLLFDAFNYSMN